MNIVVFIMDRSYLFADQKSLGNCRSEALAVQATSARQAIIQV